MILVYMMRGLFSDVAAFAHVIILGVIIRSRSRTTTVIITVIITLGARMDLILSAFLLRFFAIGHRETWTTPAPPTQSAASMTTKVRTVQAPRPKQRREPNEVG